MMHIRWVPPSGHFGRKAGRTTVRPRFPPCTDFFLFSKRTIYFFVRVGGLDASHWEGPAPWAWCKVFPPGQLSIEFVNVGGWLTHGDLAMDSCAQFLAVAEHRLIPSRSGSLCHQLRRAGYQSVWSPEVAGGHAGVGVVSLGGAPLSLPSFVAPEFREFF